MKTNLKQLREKYVKLDEAIAKLPERAFETLSSLTIDLGLTFDAFLKELREETKRLNDAFSDETFTVFERNCFKVSAMKLSEVLGE